MTVNPNLPVSVNIGASATTICAGTNVTFTATPTNGGTTPSYQWQVNGSNVGGNSSIYTTTALANNDVVKVILTSNATCETGSPATSNSINMVVNPVPTVNAGGVLTAICQGAASAAMGGSVGGGATGGTWSGGCRKLDECR